MPLHALGVEANSFDTAITLALRAFLQHRAGDVFHGAYAYALGLKMDSRAAARFASATAALKCTRFGGRSGTPTHAEVDAQLARWSA